MNVFISYGKEDQSVAIKLYNDLKKSDATHCIDSESILPGLISDFKSHELFPQDLQRDNSHLKEVLRNA